MVEVIGSSFIPKNEFKKKDKKNNFQLSVLFLISLIIFLATILGSVTVYLLKTKLVNENKILEANLKKNEGEWGIDSIREFGKISKKIEIARELLHKHYNILPIFDYLEEKTLKDVTLEGLSIVEDEEYIKVKSFGSAPILTDLQLQSKAYRENPNVTELVISNIRKDDRGYTVFDLSFSVHKKFLTERTF